MVFRIEMLLMFRIGFLLVFGVIRLLVRLLDIDLCFFFVEEYWFGYFDCDIVVGYWYIKCLVV